MFTLGFLSCFVIAVPVAFVLGRFDRADRRIRREQPTYVNPSLKRSV